MRSLFLLAALLAGLVSAYFLWLQESVYRTVPLSALRQMISAAEALPPDFENRLTLDLLRGEQQRRVVGWSLSAAAMVLGLLALRIPGGQRTNWAEERRLEKALGSPEHLLEGERHKAAKLLGVTLDAPPAVIEAALHAQLQSRDPSRMDGLAPDLRRMAEEQRQALVRARELLLRKEG